jgi:phenylacetate-CoA ligase
MMRSVAVRALHRQFEAAGLRSREVAQVAPDEWPSRQLAALQRVWADATADVPYYRDLVASRRAPAVLADWADVRAVPLLTRQSLHASPDAFRRISSPPMTTTKTAGSTGVPVAIGMNQAERDLMRIVKVGTWRDFGYTPDSRLFLIWGHSHLLGTGWRGRVNHARRKLTDAVLGYHRVDAYRMNRETCRRYAEEILRVRPVGIIGYASALDLFARYTEEFGARFRAAGVRFVLSTAEAPPRPDSVPRIEALFGCPVVQEYGGAEFGQIAFKNGDAPFETYPDLNFVEAGDGDADGGNAVVITSLYDRYTPLIRYRVGDAIRGAVELANGHVTQFGALAGRVNDVIRLEDGEAIHSVALMHCIHQEPAVHAMQIVIGDQGIDVHLVAADSDRVAMEQRIAGRLAQVHRTLGSARFQYVEDLETNRAGKRRWFVDKRSTPPPAP